MLFASGLRIPASATLPSAARAPALLTVVSTYAFVAASVLAVGVARLVIFLLLTSTVPVPLGARTILPFVFVFVKIGLLESRP